MARTHAGVLEDVARAILFGEPLLAPAPEAMNAVRLSNAILLSGLRFATRCSSSSTRTSSWRS